MHFQMMLSQRGFTGRMKLKHKDEELHLMVSEQCQRQSHRPSVSSIIDLECELASQK